MVDAALNTAESVTAAQSVQRFVKRMAPPKGALMRTAPCARLTGVQFSTLEADEIRRLATVEVTASSGGAAREEMAPTNTAMDARLGSPDPRRIPCNTCFGAGNSGGCTHSGVVDLFAPVYHTDLFEAVYEVLRVVCWACGRVCVDVARDVRTAAIDAMQPVYEAHFRTSNGGRDDLYHRTRYEHLVEHVLPNKAKKKPRVCVHCGIPQPLYAKVTGLSMNITWEFSAASKTLVDALDPPQPLLRIEMERPFNAARALAILQAIPQADLDYLGLKHQSPASWIVQAVYVLELPMRRTIQLSQMSNVGIVNDLTRMYDRLARLVSDAWQLVHQMRYEKEQQQKRFVLAQSRSAAPKAAGENASGGGAESQGRPKKRARTTAATAATLATATTTAKVVKAATAAETAATSATATTRPSRPADGDQTVPRNEGTDTAGAACAHRLRQQLPSSVCNCLCHNADRAAPGARSSVETGGVHDDGEAVAASQQRMEMAQLGSLRRRLQFTGRMGSRVHRYLYFVRNKARQHLRQVDQAGPSAAVAEAGTGGTAARAPLNAADAAHEGCAFAILQGGTAAVQGDNRADTGGITSATAPADAASRRCCAFAGIDRPTAVLYETVQRRQEQAYLTAANVSRWRQDSEASPSSLDTYTRALVKTLQPLLAPEELEAARRKDVRPQGLVPYSRAASSNAFFALASAPFSSTVPLLTLERIPLSPTEMDAFLRHSRGRYLWEAIQNAYAVIVSNEGTGLRVEMTPSGAPVTSIQMILKGKDGFIRGCGVSKRADQTARAMVSPARGLHLHEIGIPEAIAVVATVPERVTRHNQGDLATAVRKGPGVLGGAAEVEVAEGHSVHLKFVHNAAEGRRAREQLSQRLTIGMVVHRHLRDGDLTLANRAPSLAKESITALCVRIVPGDVIRLNLAYVALFNADFDGDEMTLHFPQTLEAQAEACTLMSIEANLLNTEDGTPNIGCMLNTITGVGLLATPGYRLRKFELEHLAAALPEKYQPEALPAPAIWVRRDLVEAARPWLADSEHAEGSCPHVPFWTGVQAFNLCLPSSGRLYFERPTKEASATLARCETGRERAALRQTLLLDQKITLVQNGVLLCGPLTGAVVGTPRKSMSLIHLLARFDAAAAALRFVDCLQPLVDAFVEDVHGLSVTERDFTLPRHVERRIQEELEFGLRCAQRIVDTHVKNPRLPADAVDAAHNRVMQALGANVAKLIDHATRGWGSMAGLGPVANTVSHMISTGSKGSAGNLRNIMGFLGQQTSQGKRLYSENAHANLTGHRSDQPLLRLAPSVAYDDASLPAHGFVRGSYYRDSGVRALEFQANCRRRRIDLISMTTGAAPAGYACARIIKLNEACICRRGGILAHPAGIVVQPFYGSHGCEPASLLYVPVGGMLAADDAAVARHVAEALPAEADPPATDPLPTALRVLRDSVRSQYGGYLNPDLPDCLRLPYVLETVWHMVLPAECLGAPRAAAATAVGAADVLAFAHSLATRTRGKMSPAAQDVLVYYSTWHLLRCIRKALPRVVTRRHLCRLLVHLLEIYERARVPNGMPMGVLMAQSISKSYIQQCFDSKHNPDGDDYHVAQKLTMLFENTTPKTTAMRLPVRPALAAADDAAIWNQRLRAIVSVPVATLCRGALAMVRDPVQSSSPWTAKSQDRQRMARAAELYGPEFDLMRDEDDWVEHKGRVYAAARRYMPSPWVLRFTIDSAKARRHHIAPRDVAAAIDAHYQRVCPASRGHHYPGRTGRVRVLQHGLSDADAANDNRSSSSSHADGDRRTATDGGEPASTSRVLPYGDPDDAFLGMDLDADVDVEDDQHQDQEQDDAEEDNGEEDHEVELTGEAALTPKLYAEVQPVGGHGAGLLAEDPGHTAFTRMAPSAEDGAAAAAPTGLLAAAADDNINAVFTYVFDSDCSSSHWVVRVRPWAVKMIYPDAYLEALTPAQRGRFLDDQTEHLRSRLSPDWLNRVRQDMQRRISMAGIPNLHSAQRATVHLPAAAPTPGAWRTEERLAVDTVGSNLVQVLGLPWVDGAHVTSDDLADVQATLGLVAVRDVMFSLFVRYLLDGNPAAMDLAHIQLLIDHMTCYHGVINPNNRYGHERSDVTPLAQVSFERQSLMMRNAVKHGRFDGLDNLTSSLLTGAQPAMGTGVVGTRWDPSLGRRAVPYAPSLATVRARDRFRHMVEDNQFRTEQGTRATWLRQQHAARPDPTNPEVASPAWRPSGQAAEASYSVWNQDEEEDSDSDGVPTISAYGGRQTQQGMRQSLAPATKQKGEEARVIAALENMVVQENGDGGVVYQYDGVEAVAAADPLVAPWDDSPPRHAPKRLCFA